MRTRGLLGVIVGAVLAAATAVVVAGPALAAPQTYQWIGATGGGDGHSWTDQMNWNPQGIPHSLDSIQVKAIPNVLAAAHVDNVQTVTLAQIDLGPGGSLQGAPLDAATVHWSGGTIYNQITATALLQVDGPDTKLLQHLDGEINPSGKLIIEDQAVINGGELRTIKGTIVNRGTLTSIGAPGSEALINGNFGAGALGTFVNRGNLVGAPGSTLHLFNFALDNYKNFGGTLTGGGTVRIGNTQLHLRTTTVVDDTLTIDDGTVATADGLVKFKTDAVMIEAAGTGSTDLKGAPLLGGGGTFEWQSGSITGQVTVRTGMRFDVTAAGTHTLDNQASGPLTIEAGAVVTQRGAGQVLLKTNARIVNEGQWRIRDSSGAINGANCCAVVAHFDNFGIIQIQSGRTLTISNMGYLQRASGKVEPFGSGAGGTLRIAGGDNELRGGVLENVDIVLASTAGVHLSGTVIFVDDPQLRQTEQSSVSGTAAFSGPGTYEWSDGTITGQLTFGTAVLFVVDDPDTGGFRKYLKSNAAAGLLDIRGPSTFKSSFDLVLQYGNGKAPRIVNHGSMTWTSGLIDYAGVAGALVNDGTLKLQGVRHMRTHYTQTADGTLKIVAATAATKGQLVCDYNVKLDGTLALSRVGGATVTAYSLLTGYTRAGTFATVSGLSAFPAGWHVTYSSTAVKLAH